MLDDGRAWEEIRRLARSVAPGAVEDASAHGESACPRRTRRLTIDGAGYYVRTEVHERACDTPVLLVAVERCPPHLPSARELRRAFRLTAREARVALSLADRCSNREIAHELRVTEHTARRHTEKVLEKLGVHRRTAVRHVLLTARRTADDRVRTGAG